MIYSWISRFRLNRNESVLICIVSLSLVFVYQHYWKKAKLREIEALHTKVASLKESVDKKQISLKVIQERTPATGNLKNADVNKYLKSNDHFSNVLSELVKSSKENSFSLTKIASSAPTKVNGYTQTQYRLEAESSFISLGKFLEKLEDSPLLTDVQSIEIRRIENEMDRCIVSIKLYSYVLQSEASL